MRFRLMGATLVVATASVLALSAQDAKTQYSGVYTAEQAARGKEMYDTTFKCAACHAPDMTGYMDEYNPAPALAGDEFVTNWADFTLGDLYDKIKQTMPQDDPGAMSPEQVADVIAYILQVGEYPTGTALPSDMDQLSTITITSTKPAE